MSDADDLLYLDAAASAPPCSEAVAAAREALALHGDPCSPHGPGRAARSALEEARHAVAATLGAQSDEIAFTSGGSEANALAMRTAAAALRAGRGSSVVVSAMEHPSVTAPIEAAGMAVVPVPCDETGRVNVDRWAEQVAQPGVALASIQHANHLVGTLQPVAECVRLAKTHGVPVHVDACQSAGTLPIDVNALGADLVSVSSHKAYGPPGAGALFVRRGIEVPALIGGDGRERRRRSGMPNLPGIAGMAAAMMATKAGMADRAATLWALTGMFRDGLTDGGIRVLGHPTHRVPHIVTWVAPGVDAETLLMTLEDRGILASTVPIGRLGARGLGARDVAVRFGLWPGVTAADVERALALIPAIVRDLAAIGS